MPGPLDPEFVSLADANGNQAQVNPDGSLKVSWVSGGQVTYIISSSNITAASAATDIFALQGSATKTIRVVEVRVNGTQTTGGAVTIVLVKRTSANSGGTFSSTIVAPADTNDPDSTGVIYQYSANPTTLGSISNGGFFRITNMFIPGATKTSFSPDQVWNFGEFSKAIVLRGTQQELCVNLNAQTVTGGVFTVSMTWTEE